jgi:hypothetical protein
VTRHGRAVSQPPVSTGARDSGRGLETDEDEEKRAEENNDPCFQQEKTRFV